MSYRNLDYLNKRRIIYRRSPLKDQPTESFDWGDYYEDGTYECYELFRSKAKITTYKSLSAMVFKPAIEPRWFWKFI